MCSPPADRTGDDLSGPEFADAVDHAKRRPTGQNDDHLLVPVMEVKRRAVPSGIDLVEGCAEPLGTGFCTDPCGSSDQRRLVTLDPSGSEVVGNCANLATEQSPARALAPRACIGQSCR